MFRNATFSGSGSLNPLMSDPDYETIGVGTRIFLGWTQGYIIGEGTQYAPQNFQEHSWFEETAKTVHVGNGSRIVKLMAEAPEKANVGPMAAVAGVLADLAVEDMLLIRSEVAVVENGGEVSAVSNQPIDIALLAGFESDFPCKVL